MQFFIVNCEDQNSVRNGMIYSYFINPIMIIDVTFQPPDGVNFYKNKI